MALATRRRRRRQYTRRPTRLVDLRDTHTSRGKRRTRSPSRGLSPRAHSGVDARSFFFSLPFLPSFLRRDSRAVYYTSAEPICCHDLWTSDERSDIPQVGTRIRGREEKKHGIAARLPPESRCTHGSTRLGREKRADDARSAARCCDVDGAPTDVRTLNDTGSSVSRHCFFTLSTRIYIHRRGIRKQTGAILISGSVRNASGMRATRRPAGTKRAGPVLPLDLNRRNAAETERPRARSARALIRSARPCVG